MEAVANDLLRKVAYLLVKSTLKMIAQCLVHRDRIQKYITLDAVGRTGERYLRTVDRRCRSEQRRRADRLLAAYKIHLDRSAVFENVKFRYDRRFRKIDVLDALALLTQITITREVDLFQHTANASLSFEAERADQFIGGDVPFRQRRGFGPKTRPNDLSWLGVGSAAKTADYGRIKRINDARLDLEMSHVLVPPRSVFAGSTPDN